MKDSVLINERFQNIEVVISISGDVLYGAVPTRRTCSDRAGWSQYETASLEEQPQGVDSGLAVLVK